LIRYTAVARRELGGQLAYLGAVNADAADRLEAEVLSALRLLAAGKVDGPEVEFRDGRRVRKWSVPPLAIFYDRDGQDVVVRRVRHGAQRPITRR
jgi:plasmid stabilization system protein ParE